MNTNKTPQLNKWLAALVAFAALTGSNSLSAADPETILPSSNFPAAGGGLSALIDPFSADPTNPGVFIGYNDATDPLGAVPLCAWIRTALRPTT